MQDAQYKHAVKKLIEKPIPKAPRIEAEVLAAIRAGHAGAGRGLASNWLESLLSPRLAAACLALVLVSSAAVTTLSTMARDNRNGYSQTAAEALGFDAFQATELLALSSPSKW